MQLPKFSPVWRNTLLIVLVLGAGAAAWQAWGTAPLPAYAVVRSDIVQSIVASGRVETPLRAELGSQINARVLAVPVAEGQGVKAGQVLVQLDSSEARAAVQQATAAVAQAKARLVQIDTVALPVARQALLQAEANLANAQAQFTRARTLQAQGFSGQAQLDEARRALDVATSVRQTAQLQRDSNSAQGSERQMAAAALTQAEAALSMAQAKLSYCTLQAPISGTVIARSVEPGDMAQPGKTLMVLSPEGKTELVVQIDEKNLGALRLGQPALASADAYPDQRFNVVLDYISPAIDPQRGSVEVKLGVAAAPPYLRQDMTVSVDIEVARHAQALTIPAAALRDAGGHPWVMKVAQGRAVHQAVQAGLRGAGTVEVLQGLQVDEQVLAATTNVREGQHVRTVATTLQARTRR